MPPGEWVWSDTKVQDSSRSAAPPPMRNQHFSRSEMQSRGNECAACEASTAGPCKHNFLPVCFRSDASTGKCPTETTKCSHDEAVLRGAEIAAIDAATKSAAGGGGTGRGGTGRGGNGGETSTRKSPPQFVFVTAASANHFCPLLNMLRSLNVASPDIPIIVFDLEQQGGERLDVRLLQSLSLFLTHLTPSLLPSHTHTHTHTHTQPPPPPTYTIPFRQHARPSFLSVRRCRSVFRQ
jgi:hypothetical protein